MENTDSTFLYHSACDECGSSDANSVYDDGHTYCFSCNTHKQGEKEMQTKKTKTNKYKNKIRKEKN